jgi:hypothetical protein
MQCVGICIKYLNMEFHSLMPLEVETVSLNKEPVDEGYSPHRLFG